MLHRALLPLLCLGLLAACGAAPGPMVTPRPSEGSRADGIATMSSTTSIYNAVGPDWRAGQAGAAKRCRSWGYDGAQSFAGWQEACRHYDFHGRCVFTEVTRFYACAG